MGLDQFDQNKAVNKAGDVLGKLVPAKSKAPSAERALSPYAEVFDLNRFRETELIHGRWCMLAALGAIVAELATGVTWLDAGKVRERGGEREGQWR